MVRQLDVGAILVAAMLHGIKLPFSIGFNRGGRGIILGANYPVLVYSAYGDRLTVDNRSSYDLDLFVGRTTYFISAGATCTIISDVEVERNPQ